MAGRHPVFPQGAAVEEDVPAGIVVQRAPRAGLVAVVEEFGNPPLDGFPDGGVELGGSERRFAVESGGESTEVVCRSLSPAVGWGER
jgi:hypothetical protein